jgi:hypothetical protein
MLNIVEERKKGIKRSFLRAQTQQQLERRYIIFKQKIDIKSVESD